MGSHFKASSANMKTFLLAFTLLTLGLHGSKVDKVTSCLQCQSVTGESEDSECFEGTGKGTACGTDAVGCYVNVAAASATVTPDLVVTTWNRGCCTTNSGLCTEIHEEQTTASGSIHVDQLGCTTNDCNTMDPRSSASTLVPALTILLAIVAVMA